MIWQIRKFRQLKRIKSNLDNLFVINSYRCISHNDDDPRFVDIEFPEDPIPYGYKFRPPKPLPEEPFFDKSESSHSISDYSKGRIDRFMKDSFVNDGGYLQSKSKFLLIRNARDQRDEGQPEMTEYEMLWEDINHFIDYMTCESISIAYLLNEMLLKKPIDLFHRFLLLKRITKQSIFRHETVERQYLPFHEPVLSPSKLVSMIILENRVDKFHKGMQYIWALDKNYIREQQYHFKGFDIEKVDNIGTLLVDSFYILSESQLWSEKEYVTTLEDLAILFPNIINELDSSVKSPYSFIQLLLNRKLVLRRLVDIRPYITDSYGYMELVNDLIVNEKVLLEKNEDIFEDNMSCIKLLLDMEYEWKETLKLSNVLCECRDVMEINSYTFYERFKNLYDKIPGAMLNVLSRHVHHKNIPKINIRENRFVDIKETLLYKIIDKETFVLDKLKKIDKEDELNVPGHTILKTPEFLVDEQNFDVIEKNINNLYTIIPIPVIGSDNSIASFIMCKPELALESSLYYNKLKNVIMVISAFFNKIESVNILKKVETRILASCLEKGIEVLELLKKEYGIDNERACKLARDLGKRIRAWKRNTYISEEICHCISTLPSKAIVELLLMDKDTMIKVQDDLWLLFGKDTQELFSNISNMPELLYNTETLDLAISVAHVRKLSREDIIYPNRRFNINDLKLVMNALMIARKKPGIDEYKIILIISRLFDKKLISSDMMSNQSNNSHLANALAKFSIVVSDNELGWDQFNYFLRNVYKPLVMKLNPQQAKSMKDDMVKTILKAPEIFLIPQLWKEMVKRLVYDDWRFAGMCVKDVLEKELNLFCYAVQDMWIHKFKRNPQKLLERPKKTKKYIRRGKLIVKIVDIEDDNELQPLSNNKDISSPLFLSSSTEEEEDNDFQDISELIS